MQSGRGSRFPSSPTAVLVAVLSCLGIALITAAVGVSYVSRHLAKQGVEMGGDLARFLMTHTVPASYLTLAFPATRARQERTFSQAVSSADVVRTVLYDATGQVLWSNDAAIFGRRVEGNQRFDTALRGETEPSNIRSRQDEDEGALRSFPRLVETYLPVRFPEDGPVVGVLEVYWHPPKVFALLDLSQALAWILGLSGGGLLLAATLLIPFVPTARARVKIQPDVPREDPRFHSLMNCLRDPASTLTTEGSIVSLNAAFAAVTGQPAAQWVGRPFMDLVHPDDRPRTRAFLAALIRQEAPAAVELRMLAESGGHVLPAELTGTSLTEGATVTGTVVVVRDLRERKRVEAALRRSEQRFRTLVDTARDVIFTASADGILTSLNPAFEKLTGWSVRDWVGRPYTALIHPDDVPRSQELLAALLRGERPPIYRVRVVLRRHDYAAWEITATPRVREGAVVGVWGIARDITDRQRREEALRRLNETLEAEAKRIAQELHDEAGQLLAAVHIALGDVEREAPASVRECLHDLHVVLEGIEEDLRRLARELRPAILDSLGLGPAIEYLAQSVALRTGIRIGVAGTAHGRFSPVIEASLYRAVQESLTNVVRHAQASTVTIRLDHDAEGLRCEIGDDGVGFDVKTVLGDETAAGLGLVGNMNRIEALGGTFHVASTPGHGTELLITIPLEG